MISPKFAEACIFFAAIITLIACELVEPRTADELCTHVASELITLKSSDPERFNDPEWPTTVTHSNVITADPLLCKGIAIFQNGDMHYIQFYKNSDTQQEVWAFRTYRSKTCDELIEQALLMSLNDSDEWPIEFEIRTTANMLAEERLACQVDVTHRDDTTDTVILYQNLSDEVGIRPVPLSEYECNMLIEDIIALYEGRAKDNWGTGKLLKIYDPVEISNAGMKLSCEGLARFQIREDTMIEFYLEEDKDGDRFVGSEIINP